MTVSDDGGKALGCSAVDKRFDLGRERETHIERVHATTGETYLLAEVPEEIRVGLRNAHPEVTMKPDGKQFVFAVRQPHASDVVLVEGFDPALR